jgi:hypothetical protein
MRVTIWFCALALLAGCREKLEELEKPYREKLEARLAEVEQIGKTLAKLPPLERDDEAIAIPPGVGGIGRLAENVAFMVAEDFADLTEHGPGPRLKLDGANPFTLCASLLRKRRCPPGCSYNDCRCRYQEVTRLYRSCLSVSHLLVVRTLEYGAPEALVRTTPDLGRPDHGRDLGRPDRKDARRPDSGPRLDAGAPAEATKLDAGARDLPRPDRGPDRRVESFQYRAGVFRAEVHVFQVAGAKRLGGFRVEARSPASFSSSYTIGSPVAENTSAFLQANFRHLCDDSITSGVKARVPGAYVRRGP